MKRNSILKLSGIITYLILIVSISLYVFVANNEGQPIREIIQLNYLIPALIYSIGTLILCFVIFKLLSKLMNKMISFPVSLIIGIPIGIILIQNLFILITKINM
jgi:hypothetical protein